MVALLPYLYRYYTYIYNMKRFTLILLLFLSLAQISMGQHIHRYGKT